MPLKQMNTRRDFLKKSSLAAVAAMTGPTFLNAAAFGNEPSESESFLKKHKLSVLSYSFNGLVERGMQDIFGYFETCKYRYNIDAADLWGGHLKDFFERYDTGKYIPFEDEWIAKVKEALDERELFIPNITADGCHVMDLNPERTELNYKNALEHLRLAKKLGVVGFVRFDSGPSFEMPNGRKDWTTEEFDFTVKRYKEYAQYAYDNGFKVGAENHMGPSAEWRNLKKLYDAVNHPGFAYCIHISGWKGTEDEKNQYDIESAKFAVHTHIAQNIIDGPLEEKMNIFRNAGYQGYYSVEVPTPKNEYDIVATALSKVSTVMHKWDMERIRPST
jgi:sugar phosphate isomerase/epimerase